ncbi:hypothetical protein L6452_01548 [Arctium lappa]|uniref:Uncharacterized protein n=1 Tax=Arctium lappa TaxID=4217 RepID=A0ACB9FHU9_ARCLA|nr:hypothetical protein L6452_01548 [Arctium lappa]
MGSFITNLLYQPPTPNLICIWVDPYIILGFEVVLGIGIVSFPFCQIQIILHTMYAKTIHTEFITIHTQDFYFVTSLLPSLSAV